MYPTFHELLPIIQRAASQWVPELKCDEENEPALRFVLGWACAHPKFAGDPGKSLLLMGHKGSGKTLLMRALAKCLFGQNIHFTVVNTRKVTSAYNTEGDAGLQPFLSPRNMMFDDLGDERLGQHYGDKVEVMSLVIQERYELFVDQGIMSHFTSNLTGEEIRDRYGDRVYSRLKHMVNSIRVGAEVDATDRRETATAPARKAELIEEEREPVSPEVAKEGFRRVYEAIRVAKAELAAELPPMRVVDKAVSSQDADLEAYAQRIATKDYDSLRKERELLLLNNSIEASAPFVALIDAELARIANAAELTTQISNPAA